MVKNLSKGKRPMSTIPTSVTEQQFEDHIRPCLSTAKRGYECKIALYKVFNYILYRLHTGCQWERLPIAAAPSGSEKKKSVGRRSTIIGKNGAPMAAWNGSGKKACKRSMPTWIYPN